MLCSGITAPAAKLIRPATTPDGSLRRSAPVSPPPADTSSPDAIQARDIFTHINSSGERAGFVSAQLVAASDSYGLASVLMNASLLCLLFNSPERSAGGRGRLEPSRSAERLTTTRGQHGSLARTD